MDYQQGFVKCKLFHDFLLYIVEYKYSFNHLMDKHVIFT